VVYLKKIKKKKIYSEETNKKRKKGKNFFL